MSWRRRWATAPIRWRTISVSLRSVEHARQVLRGLDRVPVELVCADVDDEMCGLLAESGSFIGGLPLSIRQG